MTQRAFATNDIEAHGRILLIPVALAMPVIMGSIGKVPMFREFMTFYVTMLAIGTAMAIWFFLFESKSEQKVLFMDLDTVSFHDYGRQTLFWKDIISIKIEEVESTRMKRGVPIKEERVVIRGRRMAGADPEGFVLQYTYGLTMAQLCDALRHGWEDGLNHQREVSGTRASEGNGVAFAVPARPGAAPGGFGRRRTDAKRVA